MVLQHQQNSEAVTGSCYSKFGSVARRRNRCRVGRVLVLAVTEHMVSSLQNNYGRNKDRKTIGTQNSILKFYHFLCTLFLF